MPDLCPRSSKSLVDFVGESGAAIINGMSLLDARRDVREAGELIETDVWRTCAMALTAQHAHHGSPDVDMLDEQLPRPGEDDTRNRPRLAARLRHQMPTEESSCSRLSTIFRPGDRTPAGSRI